MGSSCSFIGQLRAHWSVHQRLNSVSSVRFSYVALNVCQICPFRRHLPNVLSYQWLKVIPSLAYFVRMGARSFAVAGPKVWNQLRQTFARLTLSTRFEPL